MPERLQLSRKGFRLPLGAKSVARPHRWGNPFRPGHPYRFIDATGERHIGVCPSDRTVLVVLFRDFLNTQPAIQDQVRKELRGLDLACWCPLPKPGETDWCHAAVLLEVANNGA